MPSSAPIRDARIRYTSAGNGDALVFIHAGIADSRMWEQQVAAFGGRHRAVTYDLRGFGESAMVAGAFSHHLDLAGLLDHLGIPRATLIGASMGGSVALDFTLAFPERVEALILVDSGLDGYRFADSWLKAQWAESEAARDRGVLEAAAEVETRTWLAGPSRSPADVDGSVWALVRQMVLASYRTPPGLGDELPLEPPAAERLGEIRAPTLVLVGEHDLPDMHRIAETLAGGIAGAEKAVMPGCAHLPSLERPAEFNRVVASFLDRRPRTPAG